MVLKALSLDRVTVLVIAFRVNFFSMMRCTDFVIGVGVECTCGEFYRSVFYKRRFFADDKRRVVLHCKIPHFSKESALYLT